MDATDLHALSAKTLADALMGLLLIDLIIFHHPEMELQVRVLESHLMNETTLADIVLDPKAVWHELLLTAGIGEKTRHELARVVCLSLERAYPQEWQDSLLSEDEAEDRRLPGMTDQLRLVQAIWKRTPLNRSQPRKVMCFATRRQRAGYS